MGRPYPSLFLFLDDLFQIIRHFRQRHARHGDAAARLLLHHDVELAVLVRLIRIILAEVAATAFFSFERRDGDGLGHIEQVVQVDRRVPAAVVFAVAADANP